MMIRGAIKKAQSLNRYAYAVNNPINYVDRLGLNAGCSDKERGDGGNAGCGDGARSPFGLGPWGPGAWTVDGGNVTAGAGEPGFGWGGGSSGWVWAVWTPPTGYWKDIDDEGGSWVEQIAGYWTFYGQSSDNLINPWDTDFRNSIIKVLRGKNDCSAWFNQGHGSAAEIMSQVPIWLVHPELPPKYSLSPPDAQTSPDPASRIEVFRW